ncbi:hypothetical protein BGZ95_000656 [Linnemannia exigua]|uniref:Creatinase/aminopeptidase n=1 Tax=Linnemannia exigua TaxID=604196 RepID=A0AAD4D7Y0_9FUNG|nr:hypothetical protein BGZ95_000656 [Linnemannia exigua]
MTATNTTTRVQKLRALMQSPEYNVTAFVVPSEDAHQSEYVAECDERRLAVVALDSAALFTDGRYFLQASQQLDSNWTLMKSGLPEVPTWQEYLVKNLPAGSRIGIDPLVFTATDAYKLETDLAKVGSSLVPVANLDLEKKGVAGFVVSGLDEIAWLFNLRGADVHCNPVFFSYAIVTPDYVNLYLQEKSTSAEVREHLGSEVTVKSYETVFDDLRALSANLKANKQKFLLGARTNLAMAVALGKENTTETRSPVTDAKAIKNETEMEGIRQCHLRDSAALINYFAWLEEQLANGVELDEADGAERLQQFRAEQAGFVGLSFDTISSTGPNGAIIHYKPEKPNAARINPDLVYLCDSGGQYIDGTTDVTRTLHFKTPSAHEKRCFTRVLQGHISIDSAVFPDGTSGYLLDVLARRALWSDGLDFRHGTGHGVGAFLNVHEGPHGCGTRIAYNDIPLVPGMTLTNEPGYYEDGKFGIRIENVMLVRKVDTLHNFGGRGYYGFEHVTLVPMQIKLIERSLLTHLEVEWLNAYHAECLEKVSPFLAKDSPGLKWLQREAVSI